MSSKWCGLLHGGDRMTSGTFLHRCDSELKFRTWKGFSLKVPAPDSQSELWAFCCLSPCSHSLLSVLRCAEFCHTQGLPARCSLCFQHLVDSSLVWTPLIAHGLKHHFPVSTLPQSGYVFMFPPSGVLCFSFEMLVSGIK